MPRKARLVALLPLLSISLLLAGCGAVSANPTATTPIQSPSATPTPTPSPTPSPDPSPTPPVGPASFQINLQQTAGRLIPPPNGEITLDTVANNGAGNVLTPIGAGLNTTAFLQFCSFFIDDSSGCINVASFIPSATGINMDFVFPQHGTFTGFFQLADANGQFAVSLLQGPANAPGVPYRSALLPAGSLTVPLAQITGSASGGGSITLVGLTAHIMLKGTTPNHTFSFAFCDNVQCTVVANSSFTTDAQGRASADVVLSQLGEPLFAVIDSDGVEFVNAFRVE